MDFTSKKSSKFVRLGIATLALSLGAAGYFGFKWNKNRLDVLNTTRAWEKYIPEHKFQENEFENNRRYTDALINKTFEKVKSGDLKSNFLVFDPREYTLDQAGLFLLSNGKCTISAKKITKIAEKLINQKSAINEEKLIRQIYVDSRTLMNNEEAKKILSSYYNREKTIAPAVYELAISLTRAMERILEDPNRKYEIRLESGFYFDNKGFSRKMSPREWVTLERKIIDIGPRKVEGHTYVPLVGTIFKLTRGKEDPTHPNEKTIIISEKEITYVKPKEQN